MMKLTKPGVQRKARTRDNTLDSFPELAAKVERVRRVSRTLKSVRRLMGVTDSWPPRDLHMLLEALTEQVPDMKGSLTLTEDK